MNIQRLAAPAILALLAVAGCAADDPVVQTQCAAGTKCGGPSPSPGPQVELIAWRHGILGADTALAQGAMMHVRVVRKNTDVIFDSPFTVEIADASILSATAPSSGEFDLTGHSVGTATMRLRLSDGTLMAEASVRVGQIQSIYFVPMGDAILRFAETLDRPFALWLGSTTGISVSPRAADGEELIDDRMVWSGGAQQTSPTSVNVVAAGSSVTVGVRTSSGIEVRDEIPVVDTIDDIERLTDDGVAPWHPACFRAMSGGRPVAGAPWHLSADSRITDGSFYCFRPLEAVTSITVDVTAGGFTKRFVLPVTTVGGP